MSTMEQLQHMQTSWPETTNYLTRVGQINNDLMVLREAAARDRMSITWLDQLGITAEDLLAKPTAWSIASFLEQRAVKIEALLQLPEYLEDLTEQQTLFEQGEVSYDSLVEDPSYQLTAAADEQLWSSPELGSKLVSWATQTVSRILASMSMSMSTPTLSLTQATIMFRLFQFLEQEETSPVLVAESLQSLLSSGFFEMAGTPPTSK